MDEGEAGVTNSTEVCTESPGNAKTLRIMFCTQVWGRLPIVRFRVVGLVLGLSVQTCVRVIYKTVPQGSE